MEEQNKARLLIISLSIGVILIIIIAIFLLTTVWIQNINKSKSSDKIDTMQVGSVGKYNTYNFNSEHILKNYVSKVSTMMLNSDSISLYNITNKSYIKYINLDENKLRDFIKNKQLLGKFLNSSSYQYTNINGNNIFIANLSTPNTSVNENVIITEYSPNDIAISFNDFILYDDISKEYNKDGLKMQILDKTYFTTKINMTVKLTNYSSEELSINRSKLYENIYLKFNDGRELRTTTTVLSGETKNLKIGDILNFKLSFDIPSLSHSTISSIVIKDVYFVKTGTVKDIEFKL